VTPVEGAQVLAAELTASTTPQLPGTGSTTTVPMLLAACVLVMLGIAFLIPAHRAPR
jgi:hypothetical protein